VALFAPLSPLSRAIPFRAGPWVAELLNSRAICARFRPTDLLSCRRQADGLDYETRIWTRGEVATRPGNWHDFFNALVWFTFPLSQGGAQRAPRRRAGAAGQPRGRVARDAMTHFDECGVVVVSSDPDLLALLRGFQWSALFWGRRSDLGRRLRCFVFGHATYEQLLQPFRGLTAKAVLYEVTPAWLSRRWQRRWLPSTSAWRRTCRWRAYESTRVSPAAPAGLPGVTADSETAAYYDDRWQFRPGRSSAGV
jgi:hypothetical protein